MRKRSYQYTAIIIIILLGGLYILRHFLSVDKDMDETGSVFIKKTTEGFQLIRNGSPFHIRGASGKSNLKELADIGGNTFRVYDTINLLHILNEAKANGLALIVDIPIPRYNKTYDPYLIEADNDQLKENVKQLVIKYRSHPALLMWNLGNEVEYPLVLRKNNFINTFNALIDIIHKEDPDHPVSTSIPSVTKKQIFSIYFHSPGIDLLSYNIFGNLKNLNSDISKISYVIGHKPYYISEWGHDGPWEQSFTSWGAPIEPTSTKKAEQLITRYKSLVQNTDNSCIGSLVFYWGQKQERTHTWFSLFLEDHGKSEVIEELNKLWNGPNSNFRPIGLDYMLVDEKGAQSSLVFTPNQEKKAIIKFVQPQQDSLFIKWEVYPEAWNYNLWDIEKKPKKLAGSILSSSKEQATFVTPNKEGPYRIFAYIHDNKGNFATTNTPFYVLNSNIQND